MTNFYTRRLFKPISTILSVSVLALTAGAQVQHTNAVKSQPAVKTQPAGKAQAPDNTRQSSPSQAVQSFGFHTSGEKMEELYVYYTSLNVINTVKLNTGAADDDIQLFTRYYNEKINTEDKNEFFLSVKKGFINNQADVDVFAKNKIDEYTKLHTDFQSIKTDYPSSVSEYSSIPSP